MTLMTFSIKTHPNLKINYYQNNWKTFYPMLEECFTIEKPPIGAFNRAWIFV